MSHSQSNQREEDLPRWLRALGREIMRNCKRPGEYTIHVEVPRKGGRHRVRISREEKLGDFEER